MSPKDVPVDRGLYRVMSWGAIEYRQAFERLLNAVSHYVEDHEDLAREAFLAQEDIAHCAACGNRATGWAFDGVDRLCHGEGRDCYGRATSRRAALDELVRISEDAGLYDET